MRNRNPFAASLGLVLAGLLASCDSGGNSTGSNGSGNGSSSSTTSSNNSCTSAYSGSGSALDTNTHGVPWKGGIGYGKLTDCRDSQSYRTVTIGTQTWMAQNLNYKVDSSWCYAGMADSCKKYGRLYDWAATMGLDTSYNHNLWSGTLPHQGVCPGGWHVPSEAEWGTLTKNVDSATSGTKLKSTSGWYTNTGTDDYGFRILPAGYRLNATYFSDIGDNAYFWTASEYYKSESWHRYFNYTFSYVQHFSIDKLTPMSIRCLKD